MCYIYTLLVIIFASFAGGAKILGIIAAPSISHQVAFFDLWNELSLRGHQVTVITTDPQKNEKLTNLTEIDMKRSYVFIKDINSQLETINMWNFHFWFHDVSASVSKDLLTHHQVQDLIHNKKHFDVVLIEAQFPEFLYFAELYNCPAILVTSMDVLFNIHSKVGNPLHPAVSPALMSQFYPPLNFPERVISTIYTLYSMLFYKYFSFSYKGKVAQKYFNSTSTIDELLDKVDMVFTNVNPVIHSTKAIGPATINIGGLRRLSVQPLPQDLKKFLDSATNGFVYFSLGSNVKSKDLPGESLRSIVETLGELPVKVLWKFEAEPGGIPNQPDKVKLIKWAPQLGILAHPNIKLFVTQGGIQSMEETIHFNVPCVAIPFIADQEQNANLMKTKGFATVVGRYPYIKKDELKSAILEVLNNQRYKNTVTKLNRLASDSPMTALDSAVWWTEYVIRNKGAKHLRNPAADLPLYQYYLLDDIAHFSLGTNVKSKDLSKDSLEGITRALSELPYKVLWKFEADDFPNKPDNVKLIKWAPQQKVLSHPNVKVFVNQGGLQSIEEAFYKGVPLVVIPFFSDQDLNARVMEFKGIAVVVDRIPSIRKKDLKRAILEVANDPKYRNTVNKLRQLALDAPMTGPEKAIWWTEYVIRNKGAKHLRNPAADIPFYQYYLIDVIGFLLTVLVVTSLVLFLLLRTLYRVILSTLRPSVPSKFSINKND